MRRQIIRRVSKSAKIGQALAFFSLVLMVIASLAHRIGQIDTLSFLIAAALASFIALLALLFATFGLWRMWSEGAKAGSAILRCTVFAALTLTPLIIASVLGLQTPLINDVSTDWDMPPQYPIGSRIDVTPPFDKQKSQEEFAQLQREAYPDLVTQVLEIEPQLAEQFIRLSAKNLGWQATTQGGSLASEAGATWAFETHSPVFGFTDDIVVRLKRNDSGLLMDLRATGRAGGADFGAHAKQIRAFFVAFASEQRKRGI